MSVLHPIDFVTRQLATSFTRQSAYEQAAAHADATVNAPNRQRHSLDL
jgi:hypothetical protein